MVRFDGHGHATRPLWIHRGNLFTRPIKRQTSVFCYLRESRKIYRSWIPLRTSTYLLGPAQAKDQPPTYLLSPFFLPHHTRVQPAQHNNNTLESLTVLLRQVSANDYTIVLGDLNEQLSGNERPWSHRQADCRHVGCRRGVGERWVYHRHHKNVQPLCHPSSNTAEMYASTTTYLGAKSKSNTVDATGSNLGQYVGHQVTTKYRGSVLKGTVNGVFTDANDAKMVRPI